MSEHDPLRKYVEAGIALTQLTRARAEAIVKELVKAGELQREQAQDRVEELLDRSRKSTESLGGMIRKELGQQLSSMGLATKAEVEALEARLEARIAAATGSGSAPPPPGKRPAPSAEKAPPKKVTPGTAKGTAAAPSGDATKTRVGTAKKGAPPPGTAARTAGGRTDRRRPGPGAGADQV